MPKNQAIFRIAQEVTEYIYQAIHASNLADKNHNKLFEPLVKLSQDACDAILGQSEISALEKLSLCARKVERFGGGNCLLKCIMGLDYLLKCYVLTGFSDYFQCIPVAIWTTARHAFIIVNDEIKCDILFGKTEYIKGNFKKDDRLSEYFGIRANWYCYADDTLDLDSTRFTETLFSNIIQRTCTDSVLKKDLFNKLITSLQQNKPLDPVPPTPLFSNFGKQIKKRSRMDSSTSEQKENEESLSSGLKTEKHFKGL